jgi:hypothetical protein
MYQASVPVFQRTLGALDKILDKAATYASERKIEPATLLGARLYPDMFPLARQVQIATIAELKARIGKTLDFVGTFKPAQIDGSEGRDISLKAGPRELTFKGQDYLLFFALPNFYFHATTAFGILRHNGVSIGKLDFLNAA